MHVLVVDDDAASRYLNESIMRSAGHRVSTATDGFEALQLAHQDLPDLVISDILMPHMDGYQLLRAWKADEWTAGIPLAFYTASYTGQADESFAHGLGADAFWRKPMEPQALIEAAESLAGTGGSGTARQPELTDEAVVFRQYSERLVDKLDEKARGLERANAELRAALDMLEQEVAVKQGLIEELNADVLERKRAEAELRHERDFTRGVLEYADLFICILDRDGRITLVSSGVERISGKAARDLIGASAQDELLAPSSRDVLTTAFGSLSAGEVRRCEVEVPASSGEPHVIECVITCVVDEDGEPVSYNVFGVDATERRRLEQLKDDFIQTVSHELRTPLTSIVGFVELLGAMSGQRLTEQTPVIVERLRGNADRMRGLVEELLEVNDIVAEGVKPMLRPVDLGEVVRLSAESVFHDAEHRLTVVIDPDVPKVVCDSDRVARVVTNLVDNAVKYSPDGGDIEVTLGVADDRAVISVRDHGIGIGPEETGRLFDRFSQADMSSTREYGGLGLGLFIVSEIVRAHDGTIEVESLHGEGSTFTVRIPVAGP
ncbi:MAG: ATP-binding protein [Coriobacteriia bacterium]|nr:ATP-binding protein [Coriobacteriia bacterium]